MSTLVTSNLSDGTTSVGTEYVVNGSAKAWVIYNNITTTVIGDSYNVASLTDNGAGDTTVNLTNSLSVAGAPNFSAGALFSVTTTNIWANTTSTTRCLTHDLSAAAFDRPFNGVSNHGDLA